MRWVWIDRFTAFDPGKAATAVKCVSAAEGHFADHLPGFPVMPATLILEGLAQAGGILVGEANQFREKVVLAKVPAARFHRDVFPGDLLTYHVELVGLRPEGAAVAGRVTRGDDPVADADLFFAHLDRAQAGAAFGDDNFVFDGGLRNLVGTLGLPPAPHDHGGLTPPARQLPASAGERGA